MEQVLAAAPKNRVMNVPEAVALINRLKEKDQEKAKL
jgi:hypothetical protein